MKFFNKLNQRKNMKDVIEKFWKYMDQREFDNLRQILHKKFIAEWKVTNEKFTVEEFIEINKAYPGSWRTELQFIHLTDCGAVSATKVFSSENIDEFYATTFYQFKDKLIYNIEEYWATCEKAPKWRNKYKK